ncbi:MAG: DUF1304 domain-containing protein [Microbacteriaceae bacterium]
MSSPYVVLGSVLVSLGAIVHIYFFYLESLSWAKPASWRRFGVKTAEAAYTVQPWAFNQGFYNLFIATGTLAGVALVAVTEFDEAGIGVAVFGALVMAGAGVVLVLSHRRMATAAAIQGAAPLIGAILLLVSLVA